MNSVSAMCGHVKRKLSRGEALEGNILDFALDLVKGSSDATFHGIARKLGAGEQLDDYELHLVVDVLLLHKKLGSA